MIELTLAYPAGKRAAKTVRATEEGIEKIGYPNAKYWRFGPMAVADISELMELIQAKAAAGDCCIIRGALADGIQPYDLHLRRSRGDTATMRDVPRAWLAVDVDDVVPAGWDENRLLVAGADPKATAELVLEMLPEELHDVDCVYTATASAGFAPSLSTRLYFELDRPVENVELRRWAKAYNVDCTRRIIDHAIYNPVQPHWIAPPALEGLDDPVIGDRIGFLSRGKPRASLTIPESFTPPPAKRVKADGVTYTGGWRLVITEIGGWDGFHEPLKRLAAVAVNELGVDGDFAPVIEAAQLQIHANASQRPAVTIARYADPAFILDKIRWVLEQEDATDISINQCLQELGWKNEY